MFFAGLWQRPSPLYCRPRYKPRLRIEWEEDTAAWEEDTAAWEEYAPAWEDAPAWEVLQEAGLITAWEVSAEADLITVWRVP
jgi:hypothetical protein